MSAPVISYIERGWLVVPRTMSGQYGAPMQEPSYLTPLEAVREARHNVGKATPQWEAFENAASFLVIRLVPDKVVRVELATTTVTELQLIDKEQ